MSTPQQDKAALEKFIKDSGLVTSASLHDFFREKRLYLGLGVSLTDILDSMRAGGVIVGRAPRYAAVNYVADYINRIFADESKKVHQAILSLLAFGSKWEKEKILARMIGWEAEPGQVEAALNELDENCAVIWFERQYEITVDCHECFDQKLMHVCVAAVDLAEATGKHDKLMALARAVYTLVCVAMDFEVDENGDSEQLSAEMVLDALAYVQYARH